MMSERELTLRSSLEPATQILAVPGPARLLEGELSRATPLATHRRQYHEPAPPGGAVWQAIAPLVAESGLKGRGGAAFPTARKLAAVAERGGAIVVANGTEGEPASRKDQLLMTLRPHLVLDGAALAAAACGAGEVVICVSRDRPSALASMNAALAERAAAGEFVRAMRVVATPPRYVAGEETALVAWLNGGPAKPSGSRKRPFERGVRHRPTLVQNVETLANLPLIAKHGPDWYRRCGTPDEPGTRLVTVAVAAGRHVVLEAECGAPIAGLLDAAGIPGEEVQAVLVGGLYGTWVAGPSAVATGQLSRAGLAHLGAVPGAGILLPIPWTACGLGETAYILDWYAGESAGQCGPCALGLPDLASLTAGIVAGRAGPGTIAAIERCSQNVDGRGACRHPDGAVRLLRSARVVFADDVGMHLAGTPCRWSCSPPHIGVPKPGEGWR